jgi:uncharacterized membrane protein YgcG
MLCNWLGVAGSGALHLRARPARYVALAEINFFAQLDHPSCCLLASHQPSKTFCQTQQSIGPPKTLPPLNLRVIDLPIFTLPLICFRDEELALFIPSPPSHSQVCSASVISATPALSAFVINNKTVFGETYSTVTMSYGGGYGGGRGGGGYSNGHDRYGSGGGGRDYGSGGYGYVCSFSCCLASRLEAWRHPASCCPLSSQC